MSTELSDLNVRALSTAIHAELRELASLDDGARDDHKPVELDQQSVGRLSRMDAIQQQALAQEANRRRHSQRLALELALRRIEAGEYGACTQCDGPVALRRLQTDPAAALCINCASQR